MGDDFMRMDFVPTKRDDLIDDVRAGRKTPADAEADAKQRGISPLASVPDPDRFDPMASPFWSIPMAVAWIAWRTPEAVRACWDEYRSQCLRWRPYDRSARWEGEEPSKRLVVEIGYILEFDERATLEILPRLGRQLGAPKLSTGDAYIELVQRLESGDQQGKLKARAVIDNSGESVILNSIQWKSMILALEGDLTYYMHGTTRYVNVDIDRKLIVENWNALDFKDKSSALPRVSDAELISLAKQIASKHLSQSSFVPALRSLVKKAGKSVTDDRAIEQSHSLGITRVRGRPRKLAE